MGGAHKSIRVFVPALLIASMTVCAAAADWPNWRGPYHNGISNEVDWGGNWASCEPNVLWEQQVGTGFSSIAVADGRLYTMGNSDIRVGRVATEHDVVYCLDANTGVILWTHPYPSALAPNSYEGGPSATPTVADGKVYTLSKHGMAYCLDASDGQVLWQRHLVAIYGVRAPTWGFAGSPYVDEDLVIYNVGTHGMALYAADGTLAWETGTNRPGYSTPVPFDFQQQRFLVLMGEKTFAAVHARSGELLWEQPWVTNYNANIPDPVVDGNQVFVSTGYSEGSALFDVTTSKVTRLWFQKDMQTFLNSAVLWQGHLYGPNDKGDALTCVERSTGRIVWTRGGFGNGSVTLADGKLIVLSQGGELCIVEASPAGYRETGRGRILTGKCWSVPVLANGNIYARNATGKLVSVKLETTAPKVDAGSSVVTWLKAGTTTVDLGGTVEDDTGDVTTILWSAISGPAGRPTVDIANDSAAATTATFSGAGAYVLELYARDATAQEGSDRMEVRVYADSCEAAKNNPISDYVAPPYDYDNDCIETFRDFAVFAVERSDIETFNDLAVFAAEWLEDESLAADILYDP
ncbi:MAG: PQQ-binding-like beta-propeller repeat protein [Phycisphaerales bacterium]|nr:MAG: PQQ-binding-like beta-propeller repeat protein [Phycisphaerales bacterium]